VSRRGQGRRARGRRGDQDVEHENTAWLEELEKAAAEQDDDEEEWASKLRRRSLSPAPPPSTAPEPPGPTGVPRPDPSADRAPELPRAPVAHDLSPYPPLGGEPSPPPPPPRSPAGSGPAREPDYRLLGMEPDIRTDSPGPVPPEDPPGVPRTPPALGVPRTPPAADGWDAGWDSGNSHGDAPADWTTGDHASSAPGSTADAGTDWSTWSQPEGPGPTTDWGYDPGEPDWRPTGVWSPAEPVGREPDYPALFGELNRRSAAQREALWDSGPSATEPSEDLGSPEPPAPTWPFEENTGSWEPSDRSFIWPAEELPAAPSEWEPSSPSWLDEPTAPSPSWSAAPTGTVPPGPAAAAPDGGAAPDDWAADIYSGVPPPRGPGEREAGAATRRWRPDEALEAEPAVPLGANGMPPAPPAWPLGDQLQMSEPDDNWELDERPRARWPKVVAIVSWIVLLMVVCWFYVFPWLERVLPENF
jgi:hypothetical protein